MTQELRKLADDLDAEFAQGRISNHNGRKAAAEIRLLLDRLEKADALVKAIKTDRHDWEDWPDDSREAFRAMEASK